MNKVFKILTFALFVHQIVSGEDTCSRTGSHQNTKTCTKVVDHTFCEANMPPQDTAGKPNLEEIHTYAELKHDPRSSFPEAFTICSTIMTTTCLSVNAPLFFNILDNNSHLLMAPAYIVGIESYFGIDFSSWSKYTAFGQIPTVFPNTWVKSCMAINITARSLDWVVEGTPVLSMKSEFKNFPKSLERKLILGATSWAGSWYSVSNKVTNMNIFASPLSIEKLKNMTKAGGCIEYGDYLAWKDMEWILHGQAKLETVKMEETCEGEPLVKVYNAKFGKMNSCMNLCKNLGTNPPSLDTLKGWTRLRDFLKAKVYDTGFDTTFLWLPIRRDPQGKWKDIHAGHEIQNYTLPWENPVNDNNLDCAVLMSDNDWMYAHCEETSIRYDCMCQPNSGALLKLRGLCPNSAIDQYFQSMSERADKRKLKLQGLLHNYIIHDDKNKTWNLKNTHTNLTGTSKAPHGSFTLGKHNWTITGDDGCSDGEEYTRELKMSSCQDDQFTCNDGECVFLEKRCNQLSDCRDKSDERNCQLLHLEEGYNMDIPPVESNDPVNVSISRDILKLTLMSQITPLKFSLRSHSAG